MKKKLAALMVIILLVGTVIGYSILALQSENERLKKRNLELQLENEQLIEAYEQLVKYFFIGDSDFTKSFDENVWWDVEAWNRNPDSISEIENGTLHLFYNETDGDSYGNSGVYQGRHPDGRHTSQLWIGRSSEEANFSDYVIFPKSMMSDKFLLNVSFRIHRMGFNLYPSASDPNARVNLGLTLMCAINDKPFTLEAQTLWLDIYFAGYSLNENDIWFISEDANYTDDPDDVHAGYFVD